MAARFLPFLLAACAFAQTTTAIDNEQVRVLVAHQRPHARTALHEHKFNRVMIYLQACREDFTYPDKPPATMNYKAGEVEWSPAGGMHTAEITSPDPVTIVEIELKKDNAKRSPGFPLDAADPRHYKVGFENDQVRVLRVRIGPHQATPEFKDPLNRVVVYLAGQDTVVWADPAIRKVENPGDHPLDVVLVELK
jgi:hypothetical protein